MEHTIYIIIIIILSLGFLLELVLDYLNQKNWSVRLPSDLAEFYNAELYRKARAYNKARYKFSTFQAAFSFILVMTFYCAGGFGMLNQWVLMYVSNKILVALCFYGILFITTDLIFIPFSMYSTFIIEENYGFNKTSPVTFLYDKLKTLLLSVVLGGGLIAILLWLIYALGTNFWIVAYVVVMIFSLLINMFYSSIIIPLFNKLKPLDNDELKKSIEELALKAGFPLDSIVVMNGSKRTSKANAFFTGLWKRKKIVLYDTLLQNHTTKELLAILAHEIGHYKKKHVVKNMVVTTLSNFVMFFILKFFIFNQSLSQAMGSYQTMVHLNLIAFAILYQPVTEILSLAGNYLSRKQEYEADRFAVQLTGREFLQIALKRLSVDHLSNLKPHPLFVFFHYSHPPLIKRLEAIRELA